MTTKVWISVCRPTGEEVKKHSFKTPVSRRAVIDHLKEIYGTGDLQDQEGDSVVTSELEPGEYKYEVSPPLVAPVPPSVGVSGTSGPWRIHTRGLKPDVIEALPYSKFVQDDGSSTDLCVICQFEYEDGDCLSTLPCNHHYHTDCIKNWLQINKACPICSAEVTS